MNTIAAQIDQSTDILRATNDLLDARKAYREAQQQKNVHVEINAYMNLVKAERYLAELYPAPEMPVYTGERMELKTDETFRKPYRDHADERADDPRRGQASGINAMIRRPE